MSKPSVAPASGTRDFLPADMQRRLDAFRIVRAAFEQHGFLPFDTPCFERLETLTGKYGDEGEKLIFKILKRGEALDRAEDGELADMALRYDLTVPTMRAVTANRHKLPRIFKRYQMAPVWRADRPGKGRFREFYQCDVDIVGSPSTLADIEVLSAMTAAIAGLNFTGYEIRLNSRKVLKGMMTAYDVPEALHGGAVTALDKLDKIGIDKLPEEFATQGLPPEVATPLVADLARADFAALLADKLAALPTGAAGLAEVAEIVGALGDRLVGGSIRFDPLLARGLDYYTGAIFEFVTPAYGGSIAGGGRYDGLTKLFGGKEEPVCGGSLGIERILMLTEQATTEVAGPTAYVTVWDADARTTALDLVRAIRAAGASAEVDLVGGKIGGQMKLAAERHCRFALIQGPDDRAAGVVQVKALGTGEQTAVPLAEVPGFLVSGT
ncbi:MAG: histidine--tRNA ligase [Alphaproteobacteria bacterium]|nr:histidine--tRNA ligase [Alphaproteobacteria bacterium]